VATALLTVYVTVPSLPEAEKIARVVVEERLAPCANILPGVHSIYRWKGKVEQATECAMILKVDSEGFEDLRARIRSLHSYECPCIVAWPIDKADADYARWLIKPDC
jgi:periplasmic divalent cation tolerance protein